MKNHILKSTLLIAAILIVINLVSNTLYFRLDLTEDGRYTLSSTTKKILKDIDEPVTVKAYFSENLPPQLISGKNMFRDLLVEYADLSDGLLAYEFIDPASSDELSKEVQQQGIQPISINVRQKNKVEQQISYMGVIIEYGTKREVIPYININGSLEYYLSSSIKKLTIRQKKKLAVLDTETAVSKEDFKRVNAELSMLYKVERLPLAELTADKLKDYAALMILSPKDTLLPQTKQDIQSYYNQGGNIFAAIDAVDLDTKTYRGIRQNETWYDLFKTMGIEISPNYVMDERCNTIQVQATQGVFNYTTQIPFPYFPKLTNFSSHPICQGVEQISMTYPSELKAINDTSYVFTPLVMTSNRSRIEANIYQLDPQRQWTTQDFQKKNLVVAAAVESKKTNSKMVLFTDSEFLKSNRRGQIAPDHLAIVANSMDWVADDTGLVALRGRGISSRPIDQLEEGTQTLLQYLNFLGPILLAILFGLFRYQNNKTRRLKRMSYRYEN